MSKVIALIGTLMLGMSATQSSAQQRVISLRATKANVPKDVIDYVALVAKPIDLSQGEFRNDRSSSPTSIIGRLCGSLTDDYYRAFESANRSQIDRDAPLGAKANRLVWPACLYINEAPTKVDVTPQRDASVVYREMTGDIHGQKKAASRFFGVKFGDLDKMRTLSAPHATAPVLVELPANVSSEVFLQGLKTANGVSNAVVATTPSPGKINLSVRDDIVDCTPFADAPFDATAIEAAHGHSAERGRKIGITPGAPAKVAVVDNGFFGARADVGLDAFEGSAFKSKFFKYDQKSKIARYFDSEDRIWPLNYSNGLVPNPESGHGTHITGLVLGGPYLDSFRTKQLASPTPWIEITTVNLGKGTGSVLRGLQRQLPAILNVDNQHRVVNLSVAHDGAAYPDTKLDYRNLFQASENANLFVVSAGNYVSDVASSGVIPAALGRAFRNVIVVASVDGDNRISSFSGKGQVVGIAAPGCQLDSWLDNTSRPVKMSGTSQAASLVTFAASLLRSLSANAPPGQLKNRIITSGQLLAPSDQALLQFPVRLDIPRALLWFDDVLERRDTGKTYLGDVLDVSGVHCVGEAIDKTLTELWAIKPNADVPWVFHGKGGDTVVACKGSISPEATVTFKPAFELINGQFLESSTEQFDVPTAQVDLTLRTEFNE